MKVRSLQTDHCGNAWVAVEWWHDGSAGVRSYAAIRVDAEGNQVGESAYVGTKASLESVLTSWRVDAVAATRSLYNSR